MTEHSLIPRQAFLFFPTEDQICKWQGKIPHRFMFQGAVEYNAFQTQKLTELRAVMEEKPKNQHLTFLQDSTLLRFLQATKYDCDDSLKELRQYRKWQEHTLPLTLTPRIEHLLKQGMFYLSGRDSHFRPIIVVSVPKVMELELQEKEFMEVTGYFFEWVVQECMIGGQVEQWVTIVDLGEIGMFSLAGTIIDIIGFLSKHFKCRLHHNYLVNCPGSVGFLFGIAKKAMTETQVQKISLLEESSLPQKAFTYIHKDTIEKKYGGNKPNTTQFWPPQPQPCPPIHQSIIGVEEYGMKHTRGLLSRSKVSKEILEDYENIIREREEAMRRQQQKMKAEQMERQLALLVEDQPEQCPQPPLGINCSNFIAILDAFQ